MATPLTVQVSAFDFPEIIGTTGQILQSDGVGACAWTTPITGYPLGFINEMAITHVSANQKRIEIGQARSQNDLKNIDVTVPLTLTLSNSGANGLDTGAEAADTWYYIYAIADSNDVLPVAGLFSISNTTPTLPVGYDRFRFIGAARNDSSSDLYSDYMMSTTGVDRHVRWNIELVLLSIVDEKSNGQYSTVDASDLIPSGSSQIELLCTVDGRSGQVRYLEFRATGSPIMDSVYRVYAGDFRTGDVFSMGLDGVRTIDYRRGIGTLVTAVYVAGYVLNVGV